MVIFARQPYFCFIFYKNIPYKIYIQVQDL